MHGLVFCPVIFGIDKTTVPVATGNNKYWPSLHWQHTQWYLMSTLEWCCTPRFLCHSPKWVLYFYDAALLNMDSATHESHNNPEFHKFHPQLLHSSLMKILETLKPGMMTPEITHFPDGHFRKVVFGLSPYIADYPKQALLACIVQWCPKYILN